MRRSTIIFFALFATALNGIAQDVPMFRQDFRDAINAYQNRGYAHLPEVRRSIAEYEIFRERWNYLAEQQGWQYRDIQVPYVRDRSDVLEMLQHTVNDPAYFDDITMAKIQALTGDIQTNFPEYSNISPLDLLEYIAGVGIQIPAYLLISDEMFCLFPFCPIVAPQQPDCPDHDDDDDDDESAEQQDA